MSLNNCEELFIEFQQGKLDALDSIYLAYKNPLYCFIYRYTNNEQLSIDIVQDTFEKLHKKKHQYNPEKGSFKTYLFQIAYNTMITKINRQNRLKALLPFLAQPISQPISSEEKLTVRAALQALPENLRAVVILMYYHDLTQKDIAEVLNIPLGTVKSRLSRALKRLKEDLEVKDDEK
ncbi:RNA polymerase sigma factor [Heyndrickxia sp. NPDC080065]|uniref:RNA polymerase sigma factor n=1 Tax=Heyndrickxia sp. NPDC080065 TaxID=3390568 RepID=UPI003D031F29